MIMMVTIELAMMMTSDDYDEMCYVLLLFVVSCYDVLSKMYGTGWK